MSQSRGVVAAGLFRCGSGCDRVIDGCCSDVGGGVDGHRAKHENVAGCKVAIGNYACYSSNGVVCLCVAGAGGVEAGCHNGIGLIDGHNCVEMRAC